MFKFFPMSVKGDKFGDEHLIGIFGKVYIEFEFVQSMSMLIPR